MTIRANLAIVCLLSPLFARSQQANVNLDYNPQKNTENLTPFSAAVNSPEVHDDHTVTFRVKAPEAKDVRLISGPLFTALAKQRGDVVSFTRGDDGVWSVTVGPVRPDLYAYHFNIDGTQVADPNNTIAAFTAMPPYSQLVVHGDGPAYYDARNVPHGTVTRHVYHSDVTGGERELYVYTPPGYDQSKTYPVLYLVGGSGELPSNWIYDGRANFIMDNLLAEGKAVPMLIAIPNNQVLHRRHPEHVKRTFKLFEAELRQHVIPLVDREYATRPNPHGRALSGLSMGGRHTLFVGLNSLDLFASFGVLSAGDATAEETLKDFLNDPDVNKKIDYLFVGQGGAEATGFFNARVAGLVDALKAHDIEHEYFAGGDSGHDWSTWRHLLYYRFLPNLWRTESESIPLVYATEHTGAGLAAPPLPRLDQLPTVRPLTDPFEWSDGSGRSTAFSDWKRRRSEIKAEIEHYEIGRKPVRPENLTASYSEGTLTVNVTENGETLTLTSQVTLPSGDGPFAAVIGIGRGSGSLPSDIFTSRNIASIAYNFGQVMSHSQTRGNEPINRLYPELTHMGAYSAWSWGVSRLIDGLELVQDQLPIDLKHLAITGCSFAGKMALFAGAFDERIALTIAQEPGGGGAAAWRVSETMGNVEKLGATSHAWFMETMFQFSGGNVWKLPMDHHELMAMVAPRALLVLGNPDYQWLAEESGYVSCRAAHEVWKTLGIPDRFGFSIVADHPHCRLPDNQRPEVKAFVDKFLLGDATANTEVTTHPYPSTDYARWMGWWGKSEPVFPGAVDAYTITLEAECATAGANWDVATDSLASQGRYATPKAGAQSVGVAPSGAENHVAIPFSLEKGGDFTVFARLDCPTADDDSCWVKLDDGEFIQRNGLGTSGWQWITLENFALKAGPHTLTIGLREDGLKLDRVCLSTFFFPPDGMGPPAQNSCP